MSSEPSDVLEGMSLTETKSTTAKWYQPNIGDRLTEARRVFFKTYSGIPEDKLVGHLEEYHDKLWNIRPYPCIGIWNFLHAKIVNLPSFQEILSKLQSGASMIELGCCVGQDMRQLVYQGAPSDKMYASDLVQEFWDCGYELFNDREKFKAQFFQSDIFDPNSALRKDSNKLKGQIDIAYMGSFLHMFDWNGQLEILKVVKELTKPGSIVAGCQVGSVAGRSIATGWKNNTGSEQLFHNKETMETLFEEFSTATDTKWSVNVILEHPDILFQRKEDYAFMGPNVRTLIFEARRTE